MTVKFDCGCVYQGRRSWQLCKEHEKSIIVGVLTDTLEALKDAVSKA